MQNSARWHARAHGLEPLARIGSGPGLSCPNQSTNEFRFCLWISPMVIIVPPSVSVVLRLHYTLTGILSCCEACRLRASFNVLNIIQCTSCVMYQSINMFIRLRTRQHNIGLVESLSVSLRYFMTWVIRNALGYTFLACTYLCRVVKSLRRRSLPTAKTCLPGGGMEVPPFEKNWPVYLCTKSSLV